ncbi:MAG: putative toxin-antitoxin system toxin component, PIN family, partial [Nitrospirae bacterium]
MGKKKILKVVLDTNVVVSSLLFQGHLSEIHNGWKRKRFSPYLSRETFDEILRVLSYPKFTLTQEEIEYLIYHEILPYFEICDAKEIVKGVCADRDD